MSDVLEKVIAAVTAGARTNGEIQNAILGARARGGYDPQIDRAIQKAKKSGRIVYRDRQWVPADEPVPCSRCHGTGKEPTRG